MGAIRTTHTGSLPRPAELVALLDAHDRGGAAPELAARISAVVQEVVARQAGLGLDLVNDGEAGKVGYSIYVKERLTGFDGESAYSGRGRADLDDHPDFAARWAANLDRRTIRAPACTGEVRVRDAEAVHRDIANLRAAAATAGVAEERLFMTAASPGVIAHFFDNRHYGSREAFLAALADAMRVEYEAIAAAGITLQVDCPDLAMSRHSVFAKLTLEEFRREAALSVEALNHAVAGIPPERMRMHVCWGNYEGPHDRDVPLRDIVDIVLRARPAGISVEACNPRHGHEWRVWEDVALPDGRYLIPGAIDSTNNYVEHPELVAQRLLAYARVVGPERVVGGSDCGFGTFAHTSTVVPSVTWAKLRSLVEGAALASTELGAARR
ncbi:MAG TPA: cobalamin-independent methionine synthase II family protein [Candidatus Dormibacteraeota bacterium]|nr:cobalamin-independent methionine synthase II family protein [Candidatus Dormibacteraeota bacterium]